MVQCPGQPIKDGYILCFYWIVWNNSLLVEALIDSLRNFEYSGKIAEFNRSSDHFSQLITRIFNYRYASSFAQSAPDTALNVSPFPIPERQSNPRLTIGRRCSSVLAPRSTHRRRCPCHERHCVSNSLSLFPQYSLMPIHPVEPSHHQQNGYGES